MKKIKFEKGIALVALIITIIVLLILAVVTIGAVQYGGIIQHTQNAVTDYNGAKREEEVAISGYELLFKKPISKTESYIGYYADVDGNGSVDGIIYADLAEDGSGRWGEITGETYSYSYSKKATLNNYYISQELYQYKNFAAKPVIAPIDKVEENDRFYVMALKNFRTEDYTSFYWYYNAYDNMSDYAVTTSTAFGKGKANTSTMMNKVYGAGLKDKDVWKHIGSEVAAGWFLPSKGEWGAFGDFATKQGMTTSNFEGYGLIANYWASSIYVTSHDFAIFRVYFPYRSTELESMQLDSVCALDHDFLIL